MSRCRSLAAGIWLTLLLNFVAGQDDLRSVSRVIDLQRNDLVTCKALDADERIVVCGIVGPKVAVLHVDPQWQRTVSSWSVENSVHSALAPQANLVVVLVDAKPAELRVFDYGGRSICEPIVVEDLGYPIAITVDGEGKSAFIEDVTAQGASGSVHGITVVDLESKKVVSRFGGTQVSMSPDGKQIVFVKHWEKDLSKSTIVCMSIEGRIAQSRRTMTPAVFSPHLDFERNLIGLERDPVAATSHIVRYSVDDRKLRLSADVGFSHTPQVFSQGHWCGWIQTNGQGQVDNLCSNATVVVRSLDSGRVLTALNDTLTFAGSIVSDADRDIIVWLSPGMKARECRFELHVADLKRLEAKDKP